MTLIGDRLCRSIGGVCFLGFVCSGPFAIFGVFCSINRAVSDPREWAMWGVASALWSHPSLAYRQRMGVGSDATGSWVPAMESTDQIKRWLTEKRRQMSFLCLLGCLLAAILGLGGLFLSYWLLVTGLSGGLAAIGVFSSAGGSIQLWQVHCTGGLVLFFLFAWSFWLQMKSEDTARLFDLVSWGVIVEGCRGPRLSFFRGGSTVGIFVDVILLSPRLIVASGRFFGLMVAWLSLRREPIAALLMFLRDRDVVVGLDELGHQFWQRSVESVLRQALLIDGVIVRQDGVILSRALSDMLERQVRP